MSSAAITPEQAKQQNAVLAIGSPDSSRQLRIEIDEFLADNDMTNLYLLALADMQIENKDLKGDTEDWWTFYSLAGIHGYPNEDWAGVKNKDTGYCTHAQFVFPTWHRVYINMFEQAVYLKMKQKAKEFTAEPFKSRYAAAAERFRLPYWDPLMPRYDSLGNNRGKIPKDKYSEMRWGLPKILSEEFVHVRTAPDGKPDHHFRNPLYSFNLPSKAVLDAKNRTTQLVLPKDPSKGWHANLYQKTIRTPVNGETVLGDVEDPNLKQQGLHANIRSQNQNLGDRMWKLLGRYKDTSKGPGQTPDNTKRTWEMFSTHSVIDPSTNLVREDKSGNPIYNDDDNYTAVSLESWHDAIHGLVGWGYAPWVIGNMTRVPIAAFDPIFWLHHCNIDRLFAIYQALNPDIYVKEKAQTKQPKYGYLTSDLLPFKNPVEGRFYNSADIRDWKGLGFAVPGNQDLDEAGRNRVAEYLNKWYNWIAQKAPPPAEVLDQWPKNLKSSYALYGDSATAEQPVRIEALTDSGLATQEITAPSLAARAPTQQIISETAELKFENVASTFEVVADYPGLPDQTIKDGVTLTYTATVQVRKFAFDGTFFVHLFIGRVNDDNFATFITRRNEVGYAAVFASEAQGPCANCHEQRADGLLFEDGIPLSTSLYQYLKTNTEDDGPPQELRVLESLNPEHVVPFLKEYLQWRVLGPEGLIDDQQAIEESRLEVTVSSRLYELPTPENPLGAYLPSVDIPEITEGKVGGARPVQAMTTQAPPQL